MLHATIHSSMQCADAGSANLSRGREEQFEMNAASEVGGSEEGD